MAKSRKRRKRRAATAARRPTGSAPPATRRAKPAPTPIDDHRPPAPWGSFPLVELMVLLGLGAGCTTYRTITAQSWWGDGSGVYAAYWEGKQMSIGDTKVVWCKLHDDDNSLGCLNQAEAETVLNP